MEAGGQVSIGGSNYANWTSKIYSGMDTTIGLDLDWGIFNIPLIKPIDIEGERTILFEAPQKVELLTETDEPAVFLDKETIVKFQVFAKNCVTGTYHKLSNALVNLKTKGKIAGSDKKPKSDESTRATDDGMNETVQLTDEDGIVQVAWTPIHLDDNLEAEIVDKSGTPVISAKYAPSIMDNGDYEALKTLYESTNGNQWRNNTNWLSDKPFNEWYGVTTNEFGRVLKINLENNNLTGNAKIDDFLYLEEFNINHNKLTGMKFLGITSIYDLVLNDCFCGTGSVQILQPQHRVEIANNIYEGGIEIWADEVEISNNIGGVGLKKMNLEILKGRFYDENSTIYHQEPSTKVSIKDNTNIFLNMHAKKAEFHNNKDISVNVCKKSEFDPNNGGTPFNATTTAATDFVDIDNCENLFISLSQIKKAKINEGDVSISDSNVSDLEISNARFFISGSQFSSMETSNSEISLRFLDIITSATISGANRMDIRQSSFGKLHLKNCSFFSLNDNTFGVLSLDGCKDVNFLKSKTLSQINTINSSIYLNVTNFYDSTILSFNNTLVLGSYIGNVTLLGKNWNKLWIGEDN